MNANDQGTTIGTTATSRQGIIVDNFVVVSTSQMARFMILIQTVQTMDSCFLSLRGEGINGKMV